MSTRYIHIAESMISRDAEIVLYLTAMENLYNIAFTENRLIYDTASTITNDFQHISACSILSHPEIIKILRYSIAPSISQMKFGQLFGIASIDKFEKRSLSLAAKKQLSCIAPKIAEFITTNIDKHRFIWLADYSRSNNDVKEFAKRWTCSIAADQNAQTAFRNWRKEKQERSIKDKLLNSGYVQATYRGVIEKLDDLKVGEFTTEIRVRGRTRQKADAVCRSRRSGQLVLIEAKAVGVELDATKRIKECCDKASDWRSSSSLGTPQIVSVIAGFFNETNIENLEASQIHIVWEHDLNRLCELI